MDVERSLCSCLLFLILLVYSGAVDHGLTSEAIVVDTNQECKVKLHGCKVTNDLSKITSPKGEQGDAGPKGEKGEKGDTGDTGDKGPQGDVGPIGPPGIKGIEGSTGRAGLNGRCVAIDSFVIPEEESCEDVPSTGEYTMGRANPIKVFCDLETNFMCLKINGTTLVPKIHQHKDRPFWISETDFDISEFYRGATMESIQELSSQSPLGIQSIRYHCKNSFVRPKNSNDTDDKALHLLNWKEDILGPSPNERSPFFYEIPNDKDGCKDSGDLNKEEWKSTDIILKSTTSQLPIIDFHIRDIRNENQQFYIELTGLCFKF